MKISVWFANWADIAGQLSRHPASNNRLITISRLRYRGRCGISKAVASAWRKDVLKRHLSGAKWRSVNKHRADQAYLLAPSLDSGAHKLERHVAAWTSASRHRTDRRKHQHRWRHGQRQASSGRTTNISTSRTQQHRSSSGRTHHETAIWHQRIGKTPAKKGVKYQ